MKNNKAFTLIEILAALAMLGIFLPLMGKFMINMAKSSSRAEKAYKQLASLPKTSPTPNPAVDPGSDQRTYLPTQDKCTLIAGASNGKIQWYGKRVNSEVVGFYNSSSDCKTNYVGTLTAQTNPTYDDDSTNTFWNVSSSGTTLRVLVHKLNLPKDVK